MAGYLLLFAACSVALAVGFALSHVEREPLV
jgi:hypothetical protein